MKKIEGFIESVRKLFDPNFSKMELDQLMGRWKLDKKVSRKKLVENEIVARVKKYSCLELLDYISFLRDIGDSFVEFFDQELSRKLKLLGAETLLDLRSRFMDVCCDKCYRKNFARFPESFRIIEDIYQKMLPDLLKDCARISQLVYLSCEGKYELAVKRLQDIPPSRLRAFLENKEKANRLMKLGELMK
jgi:hypothetical protein